LFPKLTQEFGHHTVTRGVLRLRHPRMFEAPAGDTICVSCNEGVLTLFVCQTHNAADPDPVSESRVLVYRDGPD
jgi:hypothetical protein